jgi:hypothetical protein
MFRPGMDDQGWLAGPTRSPLPIDSTDEEEDPFASPFRSQEEQIQDLQDRLNRESRRRRHAEAALKARPSTATPTSTAVNPPMFDAQFFQDLMVTSMAAVSVPQNPLVTAAPRTKMPSVDSVEAPITFDGQNGHALVDFFLRLEECFTESKVMADVDKLRYLPRYMSPDLNEWIRAQAVYERGNYIATKNFILQTYGNPQAHLRYTREDLQTVIRKQASEPLTTRDQLTKRWVKFDLISQALLKKDALTETEADNAYWRTFPSSTLDRVRQRLEIKFPDYDTEAGAYPRGDVRKAATIVLTPAFFDEPSPGDSRTVSQRLEEETPRRRSRWGEEEVERG